MDLGLKDKVVVVTGASGGIGQALAAALAAEGAHLVLHCNQNRASADQLAERCSTVSSLVVSADLRHESEADALMAAAVDRFQQVDAVIVNHGIWIAEPTPIHAMTLAQWQQTMDSDLTSAFLVCRAFFRHLKNQPRDHACVTFVGSTAALFGESMHADYATAKAGMVYGLTRSLKNEIVHLAPRGRVNAICPGWTQTPMAESAIAQPGVLERVTATMPLKKIATPEDVARAAVMLTSDIASGHVTGTILPVAGGMEGRLLAD